jgi:hypothetical protein
MSRVIENQTVSPLLDGCVHDGSRGQHDHCTVKAGRKECDSLVSILKSRNGGTKT